MGLTTYLLKFKFCKFKFSRLILIFFCPERFPYKVSQQANECNDGCYLSAISGRVFPYIQVQRLTVAGKEDDKGSNHSKQRRSGNKARRNQNTALQTCFVKFFVFGAFREPVI